jgi:hypothetical protein
VSEWSRSFSTHLSSHSSSRPKQRKYLFFCDEESGDPLSPPYFNLIASQEVCSLFHQLCLSFPQPLGSQTPSTATVPEGSPVEVTNMYIATVQTKTSRDRRGRIHERDHEMRSVVHVLSPLPMIDSLSTICHSVKIHSEQKWCRSEESLQKEGKEETLHIPLTCFQSEVLKLNLETVLSLVEEPHHRERAVEFYVNPLGSPPFLILSLSNHSQEKPWSPKQAIFAVTSLISNSSNRSPSISSLSSLFVSSLIALLSSIPLTPHSSSKSSLLWSLFFIPLRWSAIKSASSSPPLMSSESGKRTISSIKKILSWSLSHLINFFLASLSLSLPVDGSVL